MVDVIIVEEAAAKHVLRFKVRQIADSIKGILLRLKCWELPDVWLGEVIQVVQEASDLVVIEFELFVSHLVCRDLELLDHLLQPIDLRLNRGVTELLVGTGYFLAILIKC